MKASSAVRSGDLLEANVKNTNMKIPKEQWQKWAMTFADQEANDFLNNVPLTMEQSLILKCKLEAAALYGMEIAATMDARGCDLSEAKDLKTALMRLASNDPS